MGGIMGKRNKGDGEGGGTGMGDVHEHLRRDLARVRARFAFDPPPGAVKLTGAWMSETGLEEYEAEFVDTVADCLCAGLSLNDALTCWDGGDLVADAADESELGAADDEPVSPPLPTIVPRRPTGGHRLLVR